MRLLGAVSAVEAVPFFYFLNMAGLIYVMLLFFMVFNVAME
jgi:hypothetical protein